MPERVRARDIALEVAARNGYDDNDDAVTVTVNYPSARSVEVVITTDSDNYFYSIVMDEPFDIARAGTAQYVLPIPMGSPVNVLGFGENDGPLRNSDMPPANFWMLEGSDCQPAHFGDVSAAKYDQTFGGSWCGNHGSARAIWKKNSEDREGGYFYVVDIPPGLNQVSEFWVYDPGVCAPDGLGKPNEIGNSDFRSGSEMGWRAWSSNGTPLISDDDFPVGDGSYWTSDDCAVDHINDANAGWVQSTVSFPPNLGPGTVRYFIQSKGYDARWAWNHFAFWIRPQGTNGVCFTTADPTCPTIAAENWIVIRAQGAGLGDPMELYLAEIAPIHEGKVLNIVLWDLGERMDNIQILDPNGDALDFTWTSDDTTNYPGVHNSDSNPSCDGNPCLWLDPVNKDYPPKFNLPGWGKLWRFNGRFVTLSVPLDDQVDYGSYSDYWFKIRFEPTATSRAQEWASFSINVSGDPVRLTD